jgi:hypothetical protein
LDAISKKPELYPPAEQALLPLLHRLTEPDAIEFFEEALKIVSFITYSTPVISNEMWALLGR